jgi:cyclophilin family peptidyl-prolyl cis-trans isomerase
MTTSRRFLSDSGSEPLATLAISGAGCGGGKHPAATAQLPCTVTGKQVTFPILDSAKTDTATVVTNLGTFAFVLDVKDSPCTTSSFASLAQDRFYDGLTFHRIVPGFVIQGGDPNGNGTGGPGYTVVDTPPADTSYVRGVVAMAKSATEPPGTSGSQFFVVTGANAGLRPEYALLGKVTRGLDVVERIGRLGNPQNEEPTRRVVIRRIVVVAA